MAVIKHIINRLCFILLLCSLLPAQWKVKNFHYLSRTVYDIRDKNNIWIGDNGGTLTHLDLTKRKTEILKYLYIPVGCLNFVDSLEGTLVQYNTNVSYLTLDGGKTWTKEKYPHAYNRGPWALDRSTYFEIHPAAEHVMANRTTDNGARWDTVLLPYPQTESAPEISAKFGNKDFGIVRITTCDNLRNGLYTYTLYYVNFAALTYELISSSHEECYFDILDKNFIAYIKGGIFHLSEDGGTVWKKLPFPYSYQSVQILNRDEIFVNNWDNIVKSTDKGASWQELASNYKPYIWNFKMFDSNTGITTGRNADGSLIMYATYDGWATREKCFDAKAAVTGNYLDVHFSDGNNGIAVSTNSEVIQTSNGGETWSVKYPASSLTTLVKVQIINENLILAYGYDRDNYYFLKSADGGQNWTSSTFTTIYHMDFKDSMHGWLCTYDKLYSTTDGGNTWHYKTTPYQWPFAFADSLNGYFFRSETLFKTSDGGNTFNSCNLTANTPCQLYFKDKDNGFVFSNGEIYSTTDGGVSFVKTVHNAGAPVSVKFNGAMVGYLLTNSNKLLRTVDGGKNWTSETIIENSGIALNSLFIHSNNYLWVVGNEGMIFSRSLAPTAIEGLTKLPNDFRLYQNYPNPFNPSTQIAFTLPSQCRVRVEIYNQIGQKIAALLDEVKSGGHHEINWNASGLPSGIYICRITAAPGSGGSYYSESKKMILLK